MTVLFFIEDFISSNQILRAEEYLKVNNLPKLVVYRKENSVPEDSLRSQEIKLINSERNLEYLGWMLDKIDEKIHKTSNQIYKNLIQISAFEILEKCNREMYLIWAYEFFKKKYNNLKNIIIVNNINIINIDLRSDVTGKQLIASSQNKSYGLVYFITKILKIVRQKRNNEVANLSQREILFYENYINSAKISIEYQKRIRKDKNLSSLILFTTNKFSKFTTEATELDDVLNKTTNIKSTIIELLLFTLLNIASIAFRNNKEPIPWISSQNFKSIISRAYYYKQISKSILFIIKPKAVLSTTFASLAIRALIDQSNNQGIPTVFIQHGLNAPNSLGISEKWIYQKYYFLWGKHEKEIFTNGGINPKFIHLIGLNKIKINKGIVEHKKNKDNYIKAIYLAQRTGGMVISVDEGREYLDWVYSACDHLKIKLKVKFHPSDFKYQEIIDGKNLDIASNETPLGELIQEADIVISGFSTTACIDACALGKPLIVIVPTGKKALLDFSRYGAALIAFDELSLGAQMKSIINDSKKRKSLYKGCNLIIQDIAEYLGEESNEAFMRAIKSVIKGE